jgi:hypothetical protein
MTGRKRVKRYLTYLLPCIMFNLTLVEDFPC